MNNEIKYYDLFYVKNYIKNIHKYYSKFDYSDCFKVIKKVFKFFDNFDYFLIKDINYLLQKGYIEKELINIDMENKSNINNNRKHFIWTLLIDCGFLIVDSTTDKKLKIRNEAMKEFIGKMFSEWKNYLYQKYEKIIDYFIFNYNEEGIKKFLEDSMKNIKNKNILLDEYYNLILGILSLNNHNIVIIKDNYNEKDDIRELLVVNESYFDILKKNNSDDIIKNDNSNSNENNNNKNIISRNYSKIIYITIKKVDKSSEIDNGCILALDDNENFEFDGIKLKNIYDKIIKFGISIYNENCNVIYDINYGVNFKRREMPKLIYFGEIFKEFNTNDHFFIDKTKMISKLIENKNSIYLITRPRRFGKSLNLSMVKEFFEKPNNEYCYGIETFDGLEVSKNRKNMKEFHKYPVIFLNLKNVYGNYKCIFNSLKYKISYLFEYHENNININELEESEQQKWNKIRNITEDESLLVESIKFLMKCLNNFYKRKCIVLIDEYDGILNKSHGKENYEKIYDIIKCMFSSIFKSNEYLHFGL